MENHLNELVLDNMRKKDLQGFIFFNLCCRYIDDLVVFNNKKFLDYPFRLTVERANKSDHLGKYLDLTFMIGSRGKLSTRLYDKRDDFDFKIFHSFPAKYNQALLTVCTYCDS